jgi:hypothetical protein
METIRHLFQELYKNFNNRQIDLVISQMTTDKVTGHSIKDQR